jgi:hypothetical protein
MKRVTGIGGIFFKARDPQALCAWYKKHLGIDVLEWGGALFTWADETGAAFKGTTIWSVAAADGDSFAPSAAPFMIRVLAAARRPLNRVLCAESRAPSREPRPQ